jgi:tRNA (guanine37-N1)-methyltransferase
MKAEPVIDAIRSSFKPPLSSFSGGKEPRVSWIKTKIIMVGPSKTVFNQQIAHELSIYDHLICICGRYEGIDHRVKMRCQNEFGEDFWFSQNQKSGETTFCEISLGQFVTLWWEVPAMTMIEAITRLIPWVIKEEQSRQDESYRPEHAMNNIEYPQYTRPEIVEGMIVPEVLLSGHHKKIEAWKKEMTEEI